MRHEAIWTRGRRHSAGIPITEAAGTAGPLAFTTAVETAVCAAEHRQILSGGLPQPAHREAVAAAPTTEAVAVGEAVEDPTTAAAAVGEAAAEPAGAVEVLEDPVPAAVPDPVAVAAASD